MAPKSAKRRRENQELGEFIRELFAASDFSTWAAFADAVGAKPDTISDWQRGDHAPGGYYLLKLIRAAGWKAGQAPAAPQLIRLEAIEEKVDGLARTLDDLATFVREHLPPEASQEQVNGG